MKKYTVSEKVLNARARMTNWEKRLEVFRLKNQGWSYQQIGDYLGQSRQSIQDIYRKISTMTVKEIEKRILEGNWT